MFSPPGLLPSLEGLPTFAEMTPEQRNDLLALCYRVSGPPLLQQTPFPSSASGPIIISPAVPLATASAVPPVPDPILKDITASTQAVPAKKRGRPPNANKAAQQGKSTPDEGEDKKRSRDPSWLVDEVLWVQ